MKRSTAPRHTPRIVEDIDGAEVRVEQLDDRDLYAAVQETATIVAVFENGTTRSGPELKIVRILEGYRIGAMDTRYRVDEFGAEYDVRLVELRAELEQKQRYLLAGRALRPTDTEVEEVAVVAFVNEPHGICDVVVSLDEDEETLAA